MAKSTELILPWNRMPPQPVDQFDLNNKFGRHCISVILPGYAGHADIATAADQGFWSLGHKIWFDLSGNTDTLETRTPPHTGAEGSVAGAGLALDSRAMYRNGITGGTPQFYQTNRVHQQHKKLPFLESDGDFCAICLFIPDVTQPSGDDPRLYTEDLGTSQNDHDFMVGFTSANAVRARIRTNSTATILTGTNRQNNILNAVSGGIYMVGTNSRRRFCSHWAANRIFGTGVTAAGSTVYQPRTGYDAALGRSSGSSDNFFNGYIIGVWAFNGLALREEKEIAEFVANPWQVFAPLRMPVYRPTAAAPAPFLPYYPKRDNVLLRM